MLSKMHFVPYVNKRKNLPRFLGKCIATIRIWLELLGSHLMDYSNLWNLQRSSLLKFTKTSKKLCYTTGTLGMCIGPTTVALCWAPACPAYKVRNSPLLIKSKCCTLHINVNFHQADYLLCARFSIIHGLQEFSPDFLTNEWPSCLCLVVRVAIITAISLHLRMIVAIQ